MVKCLGCIVEELRNLEVIHITKDELNLKSIHTFKVSII